MPKISTCLFFEKDAEKAIKFYVSIFKNSKILWKSYYTDAGPMPAGTLMAITFRLDRTEILAINGGGPKPNESMSLLVHCDTQREIDTYWRKLLKGGGKAVACGWLRDRYGFCWQICPRILLKMQQDKNVKRRERVMNAMMGMVKLDIAKLKAAYAGR